MKAEEIYTCVINTSLGPMRAAACSSTIRGLWFIGQKYFPPGAESWLNKPDYPVFIPLKAWLDNYFAGRNPVTDVPLSPIGTDFQKAVWKRLLEIPYGKTTTYGAIAAQISPGTKAAAQAVGGAVGHNPISLLIPCHRVLGSNGSLTGYAGGLEKKRALLELEGVTGFLPEAPRQPDLWSSR